MKQIFFFITLLTLPLFSGNHPFKEKLEKSQKGDYIVTEINKTITLLCIRSIDKKSLVIEEISAPKELLKPLPTSWPDWVKNRAPGHSFWGVMEIDLEKGEIPYYYSYSKASIIELSKKESFIATLLEIPFKRPQPENLPKIGPAPMEGELDIRQTWSPSLVFEGKKIEKPKFDIFEVTWPSDGSEISGRDVILYFDKEKRVALPYWIRAETSHYTGIIRTIDSGKNLPIVYKHLPPKKLGKNP